MMDALNSDPIRLDGRPAQRADDAINVDQLLGAFRRHLRLFLATALPVAALIALATLPAAPRYTATATVLINERTPDVLHLNAITPQDAAEASMVADSNAVDTEVEILRSRSLAVSVVNQLHLDQDPEFNSTLRPQGRLERLKNLLHHSSASSEPVDPEVAKQHAFDNVVDAVMHGLLVKRTGLTYTIDVAYTALEPAVAAKIANTFVQSYLTQALNSKSDESHSATSWLDERLTQLRQDVQAADAAVQQYKISNNLLSASGTTLTEQEISNLDTQLAQARVQDAEQDARLKTAEAQLAAGSNGGDIGEALNNPVVQSLRNQRATASAQLADLQGRYGDKYPDIIKAKRALADLDAQIQSEIQRVLSNLKAQSSIAHTRTATLAETVNHARGALVGNNEAMVRLDQLESNEEAAKAIYEAFLSRYKEAIAKEGIQPADARVVSPAPVPTSPSAPNKKLDIALAVVLGLMSGAAAIVIAEIFQRGVSDSTEVESAFDLPALGEVPTLASTIDAGPLQARKLNPVTYVVNKPLSRFAEAFRNLKTSILSSRPGRPVQVVAITSSLPGEGKTTTALCLARTTALSGATIVVVDCDLRQRSLNRAFQVEPTVGLLEVLNGSATLDEALLRDSDTGAYVLPLATSSFTPRDVFGSEAMGQLLEELRSRFDVVLLDTAPVLAVADTRVLAPRADAVVFLTRWRKTSRKAVVAALKALNSEDVFIAGVALTQVNVREQARAGEGAAHYYRAYRKYYVE